MPGKELLKGERNHMGLKGFKGRPIGEVNGLYPIYVASVPKQELTGTPFQKGDLILGVDGSGLREDQIQQWRDAFYGSRSIPGDWMITVTRWRKGKIESFDFDICETIEGGRAKLPEQIEAMDFLEAVADEPGQALHFRQEPGDILLLNNWITLHRRSSFEDHEAVEEKRRLFRIWLSMPNSRPIHHLFEANFGDTRAGAVRGGFRTG
jgi:hypothetical protein